MQSRRAFYLGRDRGIKEDAVMGCPNSKIGDYKNRNFQDESQYKGWCGSEVTNEVRR